LQEPKRLTDGGAIDEIGKSQVISHEMESVVQILKQGLEKVKKINVGSGD